MGNVKPVCPHCNGTKITKGYRDETRRSVYVDSRTNKKTERKYTVRVPAMVACRCV